MAGDLTGPRGTRFLSHYLASSIRASRLLTTTTPASSNFLILEAAVPKMDTAGSKILDLIQKINFGSNLIVLNGQNPAVFQ